MNLIPWRRKREHYTEESSPMAALARLRREMDALFERFFGEPAGTPSMAPALLPRTDLAESESEVTVTMDLPGVDPDNIEINISGDLLTVRAHKHRQKEEKRGSYHYVERAWGDFQRSIALPSTVDPDRASATYKDGVLTITIPKHTHVQPRKITVKST
jgi:HSP20 family protein